MLTIPNPVARLLNALEAFGEEAYIVGGCVRDSLLGLLPHDWDVCTSATPERVMQLLKGWTVIPTGLKHGTVTVVAEGRPVEVTTFRTDGVYTDCRHPDTVVFVRSLREDLARRDFTINAMAFHPQRGLSDPFRGQADLQAGIIRCVGSPPQRFQEDALRLLRALRFCATYSLSPEPATAQALHSCRRLLSTVAVERVSAELQRLLCGKNVLSVLLNYTDVLGEAIPELLPAVGFEQHNPHHIYDVWEHTAHAVAAAVPNRVVRLAMLLHDLGKPECLTVDSAGIGHFYGHAAISEQIASCVLHRLRMDHNTIRTVQTLVAHHSDPMPETPKQMRRKLCRLGEEGVRLLIQVKAADISAQADAIRRERLQKLELTRALLTRVIAEEQCFCLKQLEINGRDLINIGIPTGPKIGQTLNRLLELVVDGDLPNERTALLQWAWSEGATMD